MGYLIMSSIDPRTKDPAQPHHSENGGHELSDFSWTTVLWLIPVSVVIMLTFFLVCIYWFRGAKDGEITHKQAEYVPTELQAYHAQQDELLNSYKVLDKDKGRYRIPVAHAMELIAQEHQGKPGREWSPITEIYLENAAFAAASAAPAEPDNGIKVDDAPGERQAAKHGSAHGAPAGASKSKPEAAPKGKK